MHCPVCRSKETKVIDSRIAQEGMVVRRRRECVSCAYRFSTNEEMELLDIVIVKQNGSRESYNREKLKQGIKHSLTKRSFTQDAFDRLINTIERDIQKKRRREIKSSLLGDIVMKRLMRFDKVAYIRFASIYRAFEDVSTFQKEIRSIAKPKKKNKKV